MNDVEESRSLERLVDRLEERFPHVPPHTIRDVVYQAYRGLGDARIRDFVPVLVERESVGVLRSAGAGATERTSGR